MKEGWRIRKLKDIGRVQTGTTPPTKHKNNYGDFIPFVKPAHFKTNGEIDSGDSMLSEEGLKKGRLFCANSVLMVCIGATIGKVGFTEEAVSSNQQINGISPNRDVNYKYVYYVMVSELFQNKIREEGRSAQATLPIINKSKWENLEIPIPPLQEQQQIVAILDEAFEAIDQAIANIEKNIENAQELFQSKLNEIFSQRGEGWEEIPIEKVSKVVNGYSFKSKDFSPENKIKSIKITNVGIMEFVEDPSNNLPFSFLEEYSKVKINEGDLVLALTRTIIKGGLKVAKVPNSYNGSLLNQRVAAIVPNTKMIDSNYLYYYFSSDIVYNYVLDHVNTLMQPNLSINDLKNMPVPITSIENQRAISSQIEHLSEQISSYNDQLNIKLNNLEELKKSILQKAFAGELTNNQVDNLQLAAEPETDY